MILRNEQIDALAKSHKDAFVARMVQHLRNDLPRQCEAQGLNEDDLEPLVRQGMSNAEDHGITSQVGIRQYLDCMVVLGPDFDSDGKHPWAQEILANDDLSPSEKADALAWNKLFEVNWEEWTDG